MTATAAAHPLEPLSPEEVVAAVALARRERRLGESFRFVTVTLNEPAREAVLGHRPGGAVRREAFLILLDNATGRGYEAVADLSAGRLAAWRELPAGAQPPIMLDEFLECEEAVKRSPAFLAALKKRGVEDVSLVMV